MEPSEPDLCMVDDLIGGEQCLRLARWEWDYSDEEPPARLCNFHADPLALGFLTAGDLLPLDERQDDHAAE